MGKRRIPEDLVEGTIHKTKKSGYFEIVHYTNSKNILCRFLDTGCEVITTSGTVRKGNLRDIKLFPKIPKDMVKGFIHKTVRWGDIEILAYFKADKVKFRFVNTGNIRFAAASVIRYDKVSDRCTKICGVGINDSETNVKRKEWNGKKWVQTWVCPFYAKWMGMLERCYNKNSFTNTYKNVTVCEDWKYFSKFRSWMKQQDWYGMCLDKDLLQDHLDFKVYSPSTCLMVTTQVNLFLGENSASRTSHPMGTTLRFDMISYSAKCSNPFKDKGHNTSIGCYRTKIEAEKAYKKTKYGYMLRLADLQTDNRVKEALMNYYENYKEAYYE